MIGDRQVTKLKLIDFDNFLVLILKCDPSLDDFLVLSINRYFMLLILIFLLAA